MEYASGTGQISLMEIVFMLGRNLPRIPFIAAAVIALFAALWAGLIRMGWDLPPLQPTLPLMHGPLMICGFLGVLIGLERAVGLAALSGKGHKIWPYAVPALAALGGLALLLGLSTQISALLITVGSLMMVLVSVFVIRRQPTLFMAVIGLGAFSWLVGNVLWLSGRPFYGLVIWWIGFPVFIIAGERLELSRLLRLTKTVRAMFLAVCVVFLLGAVLSIFDLNIGARLAGAGAVGLALWLFRYDIARRTIRQPGLPRFIAICLLAGYAWLAFSGILFILLGSVFAGPYYDAALHALFVGFVLSMIFGHAPIILPAILGSPVTFRRLYYLHLILLHLSLLWRMEGNLAGWVELRQWGGMLNVVALLLFLANTAYGVISSLRPRAKSTFPKPGSLKRSNAEG